MSDVKFCPQCGAKLVVTDKFCGECGTFTVSKPPIEEAQPTTARNYAASGSNQGGHKNALIIMVSLLIVLFLAGGGIYWWLSQGENPGKDTGIPSQAVTQNDTTSQVSGGQKGQDVPTQVDLTRAATYLSDPGLKCTFYVNYPDGNAAIVDRISAQAVPNEAVRVSEVEVGVDMGEEYGFGFHYVERADGTYYIIDSSPYEIFPVLKNNLTVGQTWNYQNEFGAITWTVMDMGVDLDLGFAKFTDCLLVQEDNQAVGFQSITYYAPGYGSVLVLDPNGSLEYYKMTGMTKMDLGSAADTIIKWCPNYKDIKDDRTHSY